MRLDYSFSKHERYLTSTRDYVNVRIFGLKSKIYESNKTNNPIKNNKRIFKRKKGFSDVQQLFFL